MVAVVKQLVKVQAGGVIHLRSKELRAGDDAEVIVLVARPGKKSNGKSTSAQNGSRKSKVREAPIARMTKQVRGDIEWAKQILAEPGENIPWEEVKAKLNSRR